MRRFFEWLAMAWRGVKSVDVVRIEPGDVVVIRFARKLSMEERYGASRQLRGVFPSAQVLLLDENAELTIVRGPVAQSVEPKKGGP
jgi:hypothetical protein